MHKLKNEFCILLKFLHNLLHLLYTTPDLFTDIIYPLYVLYYPLFDNYIHHSRTLIKLMLLFDFRNALMSVQTDVRGRDLRECTVKYLPVINGLLCDTFSIEPKRVWMGVHNFTGFCWHERFNTWLNH